MIHMSFLLKGFAMCCFAGVPGRGLASAFPVLNAMGLELCEAP